MRDFAHLIASLWDQAPTPLSRRLVPSLALAVHLGVRALGGTLALGGVAVAALPCVASPGQALSAHEHLVQARVHAGLDEHAAAIAAYHAAFSLDPQLEGEYAHELAHQFLWSNQTADAIRWYERRLSSAPGDVDARTGLARALSWEDRHEEARREYRRVLVGHPDALEARLGEAQVVNWAGHHRSAARLYRGILDDHPRNTEARLGLARSYAWDGFVSAALSTLGPLGDAPEAEELRAETLGAHHPSLRASRNASDDSDELTIVTNELSWESQSLRFEDLRLAIAQRRFTQDGQPDVDAWSLSGGGGVRLSSSTAWHGYLSAHRFRSDAPIVNGGSAGELDFDLLGYDTWFTWWPSWRLRVDLASDRRFLDTPRALSHDIAVTSFGASSDLRLRSDLVATTALRMSNYSDGNGRQSAAVAVAWSNGRDWRLSLRPNATLFQFDERADRGYWNPEDFLNLSLAAELEGDLGSRVGLVLQASGGREFAEDEDYGVTSLGARLIWRPDDRLRAELAGGTSDSRLSGSGGYERSWIQLALRLFY